MSYEEYKAKQIELIRQHRINEAVDLDELFPEYAERWENEPIPAGTWMTI